MSDYYLFTISSCWKADVMADSSWQDNKDTRKKKHGSWCNFPKWEVTVSCERMFRERDGRDRVDEIKSFIFLWFCIVRPYLQLPQMHLKVHADASQK